MLTTLPLEAFVCREVMTHYWFPDEAWNPNRHLIFTTSLVIAAMTVSLLTCDLGAVFELIGATSACALAYILPPLCYIKLSTRSWRTVPAALCVLFGVIVMGISLVMAVAKIVKSRSPLPACIEFTHADPVARQTKAEPRPATEWEDLLNQSYHRSFPLEAVPHAAEAHIGAQGSGQGSARGFLGAS